MSRLVAAFSILLMTGVAPPAGGAGADLAETEWLVDDIGGHGVVDRARTSLRFTEPGRVAGHTGCNRFFGPVQLNGDAIAFANLATTRMACRETLMVQEQRFLDALAKAERATLEQEAQVLILLGGNGERLVRLSRVVEK
ncbi:MAG: META domain-containing protein [Gammaproteobacteria bacterium]|nr:META domain-containing protein [Gammaproteobacteria bacterium]NIP88660.1 META domain-containing protein [Gammaproteobacteria bacterium]NIR23381.1 META domain-containing protein [Gammaproteobacteria bacterium]NIS04952.1 META domain-containing protein [Gammaproteobacteria bacterium]NIU40230.1 META domain-containing protein [Gammaproteobacteria bacterium]